MDKKSYGFTLVEVIVAIAILGIIAAIAIPSLIGYKIMAEESVCNTNRKTVEKSYNTFLLKNEHKESMFNKFLIEKFDKICPADGVISYENEKVNCSLHRNESENNEDSPSRDEVPWL